MSKKKVLVFAGTRPEIIKMAPVVRELRKKTDVHFCFTGQHLELALPFLRFFDLNPDSTLELMSPGQSLGQLTSKAASQLDSLLAAHPDAAAALVQGDTTTAFTAALSAFYHKIPVGHVEAGLRTSSIHEPFPEELNRRLISRVATWHYAPTTLAQKTLLSENISKKNILLTGNTGIDALVWTLKQNRTPQNSILKTLQNETLVLVTTHRRENIGEPLERITQALNQLANKFKNIHFILPVHKNPKVEQTVRRNLDSIANFHLVEPLEYGDLVWAMNKALILISDSGGIQEEAPTLKKPVLVLRNETERPEAVKYGTSIMVGSNISKIVKTASDFLNKKRKLKLKGSKNPFGDGKAANKIAAHLFKQIG